MTRIHEFEILSGVKLHREWNNDHEEVYYFSDQRKILVDKWPEKLTEDERNRLSGDITDLAFCAEDCLFEVVFE